MEHENRRLIDATTEQIESMLREMKVGADVVGGAVMWFTSGFVVYRAWASDEYILAVGERVDSGRARPTLSLFRKKDRKEILSTSLPIGKSELRRIIDLFLSGGRRKMEKSVRDEDLEKVARRFIALLNAKIEEAMELGAKRKMEVFPAEPYTDEAGKLRGYDIKVRVSDAWDYLFRIRRYGGGVVAEFLVPGTYSGWKVWMRSDNLLRPDGAIDDTQMEEAIEVGIKQMQPGFRWGMVRAQLRKILYDLLRERFGR